MSDSQLMLDTSDLEHAWCSMLSCSLRCCDCADHNYCQVRFSCIGTEQYSTFLGVGVAASQLGLYLSAAQAGMPGECASKSYTLPVMPSAGSSCARVPGPAFPCWCPCCAC